MRDARTALAPAADAGAAMARRAAIAHATYSPEVRHPVEVGADQEAHLVAWLSKRLGAPAARAASSRRSAIAWSAAGSCPATTGPVAHFMYQTQKGARITLYVRTDVAGNRETAFRYAREKARSACSTGSTARSATRFRPADISKDELLKVANTVYQQLNP